MTENQWCCSQRITRWLLTIPHIWLASFNFYVLVEFAFDTPVHPDDFSWFEPCSFIIGMIVQTSIVCEIFSFGGTRLHIMQASFNLCLSFLHTAWSLYFQQHPLMVQWFLLSLACVIFSDLYMVSMFADRLQQQTRKYVV